MELIEKLFMGFPDLWGGRCCTLGNDSFAGNHLRLVFRKD